MKCYSENWSVEKEGLSLLLQPAGHGDITPSSLHSRLVAASCMGSVLPLATGGKTYCSHWTEIRT